MFSRIGSIFMLHRTAPYSADNLVYNENMKISAEELGHVIEEYQREGKVFLSLDDAVEIIRSGTKPNKNFVVLTLDDGYKDNLVFGYPVFKKYQVPFCIYVTNSFPNGTSDLWWYGLENVIMSNSALSLPGGRTLENRSMKQKKKNFLYLRGIIIKSHFNDPHIFLSQLGKFSFDLQSERAKKCLTWNEIKELSADPLVTIGSHTVNHRPLSKLSEKEAEHEIVSSKKELEERLNRPVKHFAFPFGSQNEAGPREYKMAKAAGFASIVTTLHGYIHAGDDQYCLDRIYLTPLKRSSLFRKELFWNIKSAVTTFRGIF
jgi:peptidoglycan/xylan/chitin deacetylase (PgdA/CDA1 family)